MCRVVDGNGTNSDGGRNETDNDDSDENGTLLR